MPPQLPGETKKQRLQSCRWEGLPRDSFQEGTRGGEDDWQSAVLTPFPSGCLSGVMAGFNMGGDLREPAASIPLGSLAAVGIS